MKAKAALVLTRTTGLDAAEAVKGLTAAVLSFNQVGLDYETVVNKLAAVDTKFAVSSRDLIEGISRSASVAQEAGVSFDELTALITTLQEKTARGGAVIGNALKTIFQRVQTTENLDYIRNLGIAVNDVSGDILPATTIIKKLADEFQNLDSATRKGLLIKIGGGFQIDKLAALLNDISNANGTFNRSLEQSSNAGNQGFKKLDELNKTVQASFDRLTTSGTQFAATIGKVAFSDDFRSILNKTSSFLESLNESISGGEEGGATIGKSIVKGIGSVITGPGALLIAGLGIKLFGDLAKFGVDSLKNQLGVTNVKKEQQDIEKSILGLLLQNTAVQTKIVSLEGNKTAQAEYLLGLYSKQAATLERMSKLSKEVGPSVYEGGIRLTTEGTKNVKAKTAAGGYMSKDAARKMEMQEAPAGASIKEISNFNFGPTEGRGTMIVNSMESVYKTPMGDFVVPSYSKTRTGKPTLFSASGYVPNFADVQKSLDIDANAYSFAGLTIGGTGSKGIRGKQLTPQLLSETKDPALIEALSKYSKLNFKNVSVGNIYRRRDQNLDSLEASEEDIKNHFLKKANEALSPQIGTFIKDELSSLGIKPTATMQLMMNRGKNFNLVNDSMAGTFFETMLKMANMSAEDENFGQFFNDSNSRFDIYGLKPDIAEQYGLPKKFWEYVEIKSSEKALNDELGTKFIQQLSQPGGEVLKAKLLNQSASISKEDAKGKVEEKAKTASEGYVPNFSKTKISALKKGGKGGGNLGFYYDDGSEKFDDYLQSANVKIKREKNKKNAITYRDQADKLIKSAREKGDYSYIQNTYGSYLSDKFEYNKILDRKIKGNSLGGLKSNLQGAIAEKEFKDKLTSYVKVEDFNAGIDFHSRDRKKLVEIKARKTALTQSEANSKVLAFLGSEGKGKKGNKKSDDLDSLLEDIDFTVYESNYNLNTAAEGYVPNFAIRELKNAPVMTIGDRVKGATIEQLKNRLGGNESYTTDLAGTKVNENLDINKIKNDMAASILGPNYHLLGNDGNLDKAYYAKLMSAFTSYKTGKTNKTAFGQMPEVKSDENRAVTGEVSGFARELKYEKLGQIFDIIAKNRNMQDVWTQIFQTKASAGVRSINSPDEQSKISKLVTQFRPVVIDELTKRLKTKVSAIMTTIGRDDAEFLALGKSVDIDQYGNLLLPDKLKVDQLQQERRFVMPLQTPENLKRVGKSKLDRIILNDPKKRPSEGEDSTFYKTKFNASDVLSIIAKSEYPYGSYEKTKEDQYGRTSTAFITGWKGEYGIENKLNKLAEKNPFLAKKIKSNFAYNKAKKKMAVVNDAEFENLRTILETLRDFGVSDWDNINFEKSLQTYAPTKTAAVGYVPNFASGDVDGDGTVTRNDPFIKRLMEAAKKFSPVGKELANNIIGNLLNMPEGIDLFEIIDQLKFVQKTQEPEVELNRIKREARDKRKSEKREEFLKRWKGTPEGSASRGYIPNFSKEAILDAIGREQSESGLPLSAIKVVQDARVRGPQNPDGYAVINNRDEPDGRVPNFASGGLNPDVVAAIEESLDGLKNLKDSSLNLDDAFKRIADNLGVSGEAVVQVFDKMTSSGSDVVQSTQQVTESNKENTDQSNKDAQGKKGANEKETKTTQDALYNLVKFQTALSFATGAMSSFGKSGEKIAEILNGAGQSLYLFSQAKDLGTSIAGEGGISGRFEAGKKAAQAAKESGGSLGSQAGAFLKGGGGMAAVGFITAGAGYAVAAYEGIKAVDSAMQIWNGTIAKSEKFIEDLTTASEKYNIQLTEQQKKTVSKISEGAAGGTDIASKLSMLYGKIVENEDFKTFGNLKELVNSTKLTTDGQKALLEKLGNVIAPQATQQLTTEGNQNPTNTEIQSKSIEMLVERLTELQKQATYEIKTPEIKQAAVEAKGRLSDKYDRLASIDQDIKNNKLDLISNVDLEKERKKLLQDIKREEDFINQNTKEKVTLKLNEVEYAKLIAEYIKEQVAPAQQAAYAESVRQEAMLVSANFLKEELDIQTKLKQLELNRITPRENMLSIEKDLLSTTEARRSSIDLELKQLEEQRRLQSEIKNITTTRGRETLDKYLGMTGSSLTEPRRAELKGGFQKIIDANSLEESNQAIKEFNDLLIPIRKNSEEQTKEIEKQLNTKKQILEKLISEGNASKEQIESQEKLVKAEQEKLQTIGASNIVLETMLNIMGKQVDYAKKASAEKARQNALDSLNTSIKKQQDFYFNTERDILRANLTLRDQALQKEKERLGYLREIEDAEVGIARIGRDTPKDKFSQQLQDIQREADRRKEDLRTRNQEIANANKSKVVQRLSERPETMPLAREAMNAKTQDELLSALEKAYSIDEKSFESSIISAAKEFKKIVIETAEYINPSEKTGETAPTKNPIAIAKKQAIDSNLYSGKNQKGYTKDFEDESFKLIDQTNKLQEKIDEKKNELETAISNQYDVAIVEGLKSEINTLEDDLQTIADKYDALSLKLDPFAPPPEKLDRKTIGAINNLEQPLDQRKQEESIDKTKQFKTEAAIFAERSRVEFGLGMKESLSALNTQVEEFGNTLGKQIPMNFRDGLVDAMKALSDPNATTSLGERLMGVATAFVNKINDALMTKAANQLTTGLFGNGQPGTGVAGMLGFASGGIIKGGSGNKDDVPAMLMGGEYVIKKNAVNKYGKDFFDKLNAGKLKGFANGGLVETDLNDLIKNPTKYTPYGQTRMGGLSFDENGKAIGIDNYTGTEEDKQNAILRAQTDFYSRDQQTGEGGFFMPGTYGRGAIVGQKNLLAYATQQTAGTQYDKISSSGSGASIDLAAGSGNLSLFALRDQGNVRNAQYLESKNKALDLYFQGYQASKDKIQMDFDNQKRYEEQLKAYEEAKKQAKKQARNALMSQLISAGVSMAVSAVGNSMMAGKTAAQQAFASGQPGAEKPGFFTGMWGGAKINGETFGGLGNALKFDSNAFKTANLLGVSATATSPGGALGWNAKNQSYEPLTMGQYNAIAPMGVSWSKGSVGTPYSWQRRAAGGYVAGNGMGDNVPAMLNGGEFVVSKEAAQKTGYGALQKLNSTGATGGDSGEMTSRIEAKLEELVEKIAGVGTINISVNSDGKGGEKESQSDSKQDQQNKELARRIKEVVLSVLRDEKRLGGMLR
jgi:TP901 family phage tail tape measure protein